MYFFYRILTALGMIFLAPYYAWRARNRDENRHSYRERLGILPPSLTEGAKSAHGNTWVHAVSVGEVLAAKPLVEALRKSFPERAIFVSTTTETGRRLAIERLQSADGIFYFPLDWTVSVRRAMETIRPTLIIIMETEIWPNFLREAKQQKIPVIFANARISERSFARFKKWRFFVEPFFEHVLRDADLFLAQTPEDAARLREMGAPEERIEVTGNLKYDAAPPAIGEFGNWLASQAKMQERWPVLVAGSVVADEEDAVLAAYDIVQRHWRRALLVLAPRKPDRFDVTAELASGKGWKVIRRSGVDLNAPLDENADVLIVDSIGELAGLYSIADAVFVGGSLVSSGGHNILEPAWFSRPPVFGPSMENFKDMSAQFLAARAGIQVRSGEQLGKVWTQLIENNSLRDEMGKAALKLSSRNRGATARVIERIAAILRTIGTAA